MIISILVVFMRNLSSVLAILPLDLHVLHIHRFAFLTIMNETLVFMTLSLGDG